MEKKIRKYLHDVLDCITAIESFLGEKPNFDFYKSNRLLRSGVERELTVIGEAINRVLKVDPKCQIASARQIVNFRNFITHEYEDIEDDVVWTIANRDLPKLKLEINSLLNN